MVPVRRQHKGVPDVPVATLGVALDGLWAMAWATEGWPQLEVETLCRVPCARHRAECLYGLLAALYYQMRAVG